MLSSAHPSRVVDTPRLPRVKLVIVGGGGFRVPLVFRALLDSPGVVDEVALVDVNPARLTSTVRVLDGMRSDALAAPALSATTDTGAALTGAGVVFVAMRVGGLAGRVADERIALDLGLLGQETTGPGGIAFGLRTVGPATQLAHLIAQIAPTAWVINFTNPAGMITEAMQRVLGSRVIGICDSPIALGRRAARALGHSLAEVDLGYAGLNHLGWLRSLSVDGVDLLPRLLADDAALAPIEETHLFGAEWLRQLGAIPNEYLYFYYYSREAITAARAATLTRGEFLAAQQHRYYVESPSEPTLALAHWESALAERNATYLSTERGDGVARDQDDIVSGGYEGVALALMRALTHGVPARLILNVANRGALAGLDDQAVVEIPCRADAAGVHPMPTPTLDGPALGLVQQVKAVDRLVIDAALTGDPGRAVAAFALHPLVDSVSSARALLAGYRFAIPLVDAVFSGQTPELPRR